MGRNLIIGDIHSRYEKLTAVLEKAGFNPGFDVLYSTGDFCDRGEQPVEVLDYLMKLGDSFRPVLGNHDAWLESALAGVTDPNWTDNNGGAVTEKAVFSMPEEWRGKLKEWLARIPLVRVTDDYLIMHAGIPAGMDESSLCSMASMERPVPIFMLESEFMNLVRMGIDMREYQTMESIYWDRDYLLSAIAAEYGEKGDLTPFPTNRAIWIGHSALRSGKPFHSDSYRLYAVDTGAGMGGPLTLMDMDTKEFWQD